MLIKLNKNITIAQVNKWLSKGAEIERHGFKIYILTGDVVLINLINRANNE